MFCFRALYLSQWPAIFQTFLPPPSLGFCCCFPLVIPTHKLPYWVTLGKFNRCCPLKEDFCNDVRPFLQQQPGEPEHSSQQLVGLNRKRKNNNKKNQPPTASVLIHSDDFYYLESLGYKVRGLSLHFLLFNISVFSPELLSLSFYFSTLKHFLRLFGICIFQLVGDTVWENWCGDLNGGDSSVPRRAHL